MIYGSFQALQLATVWGASLVGSVNGFGPGLKGPRADDKTPNIGWDALPITFNIFRVLSG